MVVYDSNITSGRQEDPWTTSCRSTIVLWRMGMWLPKQFDEHAFSCNHKVNLSNTSVIDAHTHTQTCCMLKSWHIQHQHATLNKGIGTMLPFSLFPFFLFPATNLIYEHMSHTCLSCCIYMCLMWSHQHLSFRVASRHKKQFRRFGFLRKPKRLNRIMLDSQTPSVTSCIYIQRPM